MVVDQWGSYTLTAQAASEFLRFILSTTPGVRHPILITPSTSAHSSPDREPPPAARRRRARPASAADLEPHADEARMRVAIDDEATPSPPVRSTTTSVYRYSVCEMLHGDEAAATAAMKRPRSRSPRSTPPHTAILHEQSRALLANSEREIASVLLAPAHLGLHVHLASGKHQRNEGNEPGFGPPVERHEHAPASPAVLLHLTPKAYSTLMVEYANLIHQLAGVRAQMEERVGGLIAAEASTQPSSPVLAPAASSHKSTTTV